MGEEFEEIEVEYPSPCGDEIDLNYEFDAPRFFDFTRRETFWDAAEAEQWFEFAESYPPPPFLMKLRRGNAMESVDNVAGSCMEHEQVSSIEENDGRGLEFCDQAIQDTSNGKTKFLSKSKSKVWTFMKPTASHLAKQKNTTEVQTPRSFRRFQNQKSSSIDDQLTKRQKLEAGYLRKVARLKHQTLFTHKKPMEVPKVTVPKEPNLETALRAQRHKSRTRTDTESAKHTESSCQMFKARPLNKKILEARTRTQPLQKKKTPQAGGILNGNSVSNSETRDIKRINSSDGSTPEKCGMINKLRGSLDDKRHSSKGERGVFRSIKIFPLEPNNKRFLNEPPTELLSKLSLASEVKQTAKSLSKEKSISKGFKENRPGSLHEEHEKVNLVKEEIQTLCGKQYQCLTEMGSFIYQSTTV